MSRRNKVVSGEPSSKMATTHFEVIGILGVDDIGIRHYRHDEILENTDKYESMILFTRMFRPFFNYCF